MRKIEREYAGLCRSHGFNLITIEQRKGHYALYFEAGVVLASGTPSDYRNRANTLAQIKRLCGR